jgi:hypothetical protein
MNRWAIILAILGLGASSSLTGCRQDVYCADDQICINYFGPNAYCKLNGQASGQCYLKIQSALPDMSATQPVSMRSCQASLNILHSTTVTNSAGFGTAVATNGSEVLIGSPLSVGSSNAEIFAQASGSYTGTSLGSQIKSDTLKGIGVALTSGQALVNAKANVYLFGGSGTTWTLQSTLTPAAGTSFLSAEMGASFTSGLGFAGYLDGAAKPQCWTEVYQISGSPPMTEPACTSFPMTWSCINPTIVLAASAPWLLVGSAGGNTSQPPTLCNTSSLCGTAPSCAAVTAPAAATSQFGTSVGLTGNLAVVGDPGQTAQPFWVYTYDSTSGSSAMGMQPAAISNTSTGDGWGTSLAIANDLLAVGAPGVNSKVGNVAIYQYIDGTWKTLLTTGPPPDTSPVTFSKTTAHFGGAVAVAGDLVVVGAPGATVIDATNTSQSSAGAAVVYSCPMM